MPGATITETASATFDFYGPVHKGLRRALCGLLVRIGASDFRDAGAIAALTADLRDQLTISARHLAHEDEHIHAALEARAPGTSGRLADQHDDHHACMADLERILAELEAAPAAERPALGRRLYLRFSQFVAEDLEHMAEEELVTLPLLQRLFTDAELMAIEQRIIASIPPERGIATMQLILPALNREERANLLGVVRGSAPPEIFAAVLDLAARPALAPDDWQDLARRLDLAA